MRVMCGALSAVLLWSSAAVAATECGRQPAGGSAGAGVWQAGEAVGFSSPRLRVDADGAPDSYRVDGNGLSYTCDGVVAVINGVRHTNENDPDNWQRLCREAWTRARSSGNYSGVAIFGFATDSQGRPIVQQQGDPFPGEAFLTTTTLSVPGTPDGTQRHYVDATAIPYVVLSRGLTQRFNVAPGDLVAVYRPATKLVAYGVYGDCCKLGEASVRLHQDLGSDPVVLRGSVRRAKREIEDRVVTVVFPGKHAEASADLAAWYRSIQTEGAAALQAWGGMDRLRACAG